MRGKSIAPVQDICHQPENTDFSLRFGDAEQQGSGHVFVYLRDIYELFRSDVDQYRGQIDEDAVDLLTVATLHHGVDL